MDSQKNDYTRQFLIEARDILDAVAAATLAVEADPSNSELLNAIFRGIHTIKGSAAMFGLDCLSECSHELENLLNSLREGGLSLTPEVVDVVLQGLDALGEMHAALARGDTPGSYDELVASFVRLTPARANAPAGAMAGPAAGCRAPIPILPETVRQALEAALAGAGDGQARPFLVRLGFASEDLANGFDPLVFLRNLKEACFYCHPLPTTAVPPCQELSPLCLYLRPDVVVATRLAAQDIRDLAFDPELIDVTELDRPGAAVAGDGPSDPGPAPAAEDALPEGEQTPSRAAKPLGRILVEARKITEADLDQALARQAADRAAEPDRQAELKVMRVDEAKIDAFNNMIGELVIARNAYDFLVEGLEAGATFDSGEKKRLKDNLRLFSRITGELQRGVMALRLVPIRGIFQKYVRVVRDISRQQDKRIDYRTEGGETEIDKKIADLLSEPLIHMIRNACDHGLETPRERLEAGKSEVGRLTLEASREGRTLRVVIRDDGRGMDREKVREKALRLGMAVGDPEDPRFFDVIFQPGFSTKEAVSELSGRGVGMDVVKSALESLNGTIQVDSELGKGTAITLSIPMSMGVSVALQVESGGQPYAIPIEHVLETLLVTQDDVHALGDVQGMAYRGAILPVARLDRLLAGEMGLPADGQGEADGREYPVVVVGSSRGNYGLLVDRLLRNCEIAIKPAPDSLAGLDYLSGVTILGDGRVLLVLNPEYLVCGPQAYDQ